MLYLSTRNKADSFTAYRVLHSADAPDGGQFLPMQIPILSEFQLAQLERMSFGEVTAYIMNLFFGTKITGWDVDFAVGRQALSIVFIGHRAAIAESWHNPAGSHGYYVQRLYELVCDNKQVVNHPSLWFETVVHIAILFGMCAKFCQQGICDFDIAVESGDLQQLLAIRYAQKMGLPAANIILGTLDGDGMWEFLLHGDYQCAGRTTVTGLETLLWLEFGHVEAGKYRSCLEKKTIYHLAPILLDQLRRGISASVVGDHRVQMVISSAQQSGGYGMEPQTARAFGALQDHRAKTGTNRNTLLISHSRPQAH